MPNIPQHARFIDAPEPNEEGGFYVSAIDGTKYAGLLGPFQTHSAAAEKVRNVSDYVCARKPEAHWWSFGTCRLESKDGDLPNGALNNLIKE